MENFTTGENLTKLIIKYAVILIAFNFLSQFGYSFGTYYFLQLFPVDITANPNLSKLKLSLATSLMSITMNLVVALVILFDTEKKSKLTWTIFVLALFSTWPATILFIIAKATGIEKNQIDS